MDLPFNQGAENPANPNQNHRPPLNCKPSSTLWFLSLSVLLISLTLGIANTRLYKLHSLRSTLSGPLQPMTQKTLDLSEQTTISKPQINVLWMAPFLSGGGYSSEAWSYVTALEETGQTNFNLMILHHGDQEALDFWDGLPEKTRLLAQKLYYRGPIPLNQTVIICHSEPGAWYPPLFLTLPCPPTGYKEAAFVIGRTMFETDRLNPEHVARCNKMNSIWVPTDFHISTFLKSGVNPTKIRKIIQPVDVDFFNPEKWKPQKIQTLGRLVLGRPNSQKSSELLPSNADFVFLSVFKWEFRKGWDILLKAYLQEFEASDNVFLSLITNRYHFDEDIGTKIKEFLENSNMTEPNSGWAPINLIDAHIPQRCLPEIYKGADAFVLASRGEGWGRPIVEAMAMALPVISTNWSGPREYMTEENSYPLPVEGMRVIGEGPFKGHLWAEPSVNGLRILMRRVWLNGEERERKGKKGREDMVRRFSPHVVARVVVDEILQLLKEEM
ncbi:hypothetical protein AMTRI_Chr11g95360 [Amborella trichopoda]